VSQETENKAIVGRWFTEFWGPNYNPDVIDELAAPDIRFEYSMHAPLRGRDQVREFARKFRAAFPDLGFGGTADLIADGDYVVGQWKGGGTQTGDAFDDLPSAPYRPEPARRWTSPAPPSSRSRTASSPRRSASTTESLFSSSSASFPTSRSASTVEMKGTDGYESQGPRVLVRRRCLRRLALPCGGWRRS
jgi:hypothetical protein